MKKFMPKKSEVEQEQPLAEELKELLDATSSETTEETTQEGFTTNTLKEEPVPVMPVVEEVRSTVIEKGTEIQGDLKIKGNLEMYGEVIGNIDCESHVVLDGIVKGNIVCHSAQFDGGVVTGDVLSKDKVYFGEKTEVFGELRANVAEVFGKIKGDCQVTSDLFVKGSGAVIGDINAGNITIEKGAIIQGAVKIIKDVYFEFDA